MIGLCRTHGRPEISVNVIAQCQYRLHPDTLIAVEMDSQRESQKACFGKAAVRKYLHGQKTPWRSLAAERVSGWTRANGFVFDCNFFQCYLISERNVLFTRIQTFLTVCLGEVTRAEGCFMK